MEAEYHVETFQRERIHEPLVLPTEYIRVNATIVIITLSLRSFCLTSPLLRAYSMLVHSFISGMHGTPLQVRSAKRRHQSPEWEILSQVD